MRANVPASASGTVMLAMNVGQNRRRNRKMTITTSAMLSISENCTSWTEARIVVVRSLISLSLTDGGIHRLELRQNGANPVHGLNDVGIRLLEEDDQHGAVGAGPAGDPRVFGGVNGPAQRAQSEWARCYAASGSGPGSPCPGATGRC